MVHVTSGYIDEQTALTNYTYRKKTEYKPNTPHGATHSPYGRNTPFSKTSKAPKARIAPDTVTIIHAESYSSATPVNYTSIEIAYKEHKGITKDSTPSKGTKLVKARYVKARGGKN